MRLNRCPTCHGHVTLDALAQDDAARELLALFAGLDAPLGRALIGYLGLFRPSKRDLSHDRALRLAREALALCSDSMRLARALGDTVESIRGKGGAVLKNHNYLARVLESTPATCAVLAPEPATRKGPPSKHRAALDAIDGG